MNIPSKFLEEAVEYFGSLPGIGKRTALRMVLHLLKRDQDQLERFGSIISELKSQIKTCVKCGNLSDYEACSICSNENRNQRLVCVVEDVRDVMAIEATAAYNGRYHVLGGVISPMDGIGPNDLFLEPLMEELEKEQIDEVILALSPTMEGDTTNFYLYKKTAPYSIKITTLSRGIAVGSELHYADEVTLSRSIQQRVNFQL